MTQWSIGERYASIALRADSRITLNMESDDRTATESDARRHASIITSNLERHVRRAPRTSALSSEDLCRDLCRSGAALALRGLRRRAADLTVLSSP